MTSYLVGLIGSGHRPVAQPASARSARRDHHGLRYVYRLIDLGDLGLAADDVGELVRTAPAARLRRAQHHPPLQADRHPAPGRAVPRRRRCSGAVNTVVFDGRPRHRPQHRLDGLRRVLRPRAARRAHRPRRAARARAGRARPSRTRCSRLGADAGHPGRRRPGRRPALAAELAGTLRRGPRTRRGPAELAGLLPGADGLVHATPTGMAAASRAAAARRAAAPRRSGWPTSSTARWRPGCCATPGRSAAAPWTAAAWSSSRPRTPSACSPAGSPTPNGCSPT